MNHFLIWINCFVLFFFSLIELVWLFVHRYKCKVFVFRFSLLCLLLRFLFLNMDFIKCISTTWNSWTNDWSIFVSGIYFHYHSIDRSRYFCPFHGKYVCWNPIICVFFCLSIHLKSVRLTNVLVSILLLFFGNIDYQFGVELIKKIHFSNMKSKWDIHHNSKRCTGIACTWKYYNFISSNTVIHVFVHELIPHSLLVMPIRVTFN